VVAFLAAISLLWLRSRRGDVERKKGRRQELVQSQLGKHMRVSPARPSLSICKVNDTATIRIVVRCSLFVFQFSIVEYCIIVVLHNQQHARSPEPEHYYVWDRRTARYFFMTNAGIH
jgi:hypothetical protein